MTFLGFILVGLAGLFLLKWALFYLFWWDIGRAADQEIKAAAAQQSLANSKPLPEVRNPEDWLH